MAGSLKKIYREDSPYKAYLLSLLSVGVAYGLYKGIIDNYLAEVVSIGEFDRGIEEFFRELPGLLLVVVCFFYGFSEHFFPTNVSFIICCSMYVLDSIISLASMASNVYVQSLSDSPEETRATIATGVSVNHLVTIFVALLGGWVWKVTGIEMLFTISAIIGLFNSLFAGTIKTRKTE